MATLAINHLLDYGKKIVANTLALFKDQGVETVRGGVNLKEASKILFLNTKEGKIAVVNFAENEWASATNFSPGANPMDIVDNVSQIKDAREQADYVIIIVHGEHEYYNLPSPRMLK